MGIINVINDKYGLLTVVDQKREKNRTYYFCKCNCGIEKWIRADGIRSGAVKSCGCLSKETQFKPNDLIGKRFGRLVAIKDTGKRDKHNGSVIWECKCDCGNVTNADGGGLTTNAIKSCGCLQKETMKHNGKKVGELHIENKIVEGTNLQVLERTTPFNNNTSGVTGISWDSSREKWKAQIWFKNKKYHLGRYENKEDAIKARKEAEEKLHKDFLREKGIID